MTRMENILMTDTDKPPSSNWFRRLFPRWHSEPADRTQLTTFLRRAVKKHLLDTESLSMIEGVLQVSELKVRDIMVPRAQMQVIESDATLESIIKVINDTHHSRYPVIGESRDEVSGILLAKDLIHVWFKDPTVFQLNKLLRPAVFIPESKRLNVLLREFRLNHNHMAIVADEYGGISGLVTIEDVLEQIVGEIEDESDTDDSETHIKKLAANQYTVKALTTIEEFNEAFHCDLSHEEFDTIGGLVMHDFGHLPQRGESVRIERFKFKVLHADNRRVRLLKVSVDEV